MVSKYSSKYKEPELPGAMTDLRSEQEGTRWVRDILLCQEARKLSRIDETVSKGHWNQTEGAPIVHAVKIPASKNNDWSWLKDIQQAHEFIMIFKKETNRKVICHHLWQRLNESLTFENQLLKERANLSHLSNEHS